MFQSVQEALEACEAAGYQPRSHVNGLGEQTYWVHPPCSDRGWCYWGDAQFLSWANGYWRLLEIRKIRDQADWEELSEEESPSGQHGWHSPCGTHESAWRAMGRPMPEEAALAAA